MLVIYQTALDLIKSGQNDALLHSGTDILLGRFDLPNDREVFVRLHAQGEIRALYWPELGKEIDLNNFNIRDYFHSDTELGVAIRENKLRLNNNNWFEIMLIYKDEPIYGVVDDKSPASISEAIEEVIHLATNRYMLEQLVKNTNSVAAEKVA